MNKLFIIFLCWSLPFFAQNKGRNADENFKPQKESNKKPSVFFTDVPKHDYDVILFSPTENSMEASILSYENAEIYIKQNSKKSSVFRVKANEPYQFSFKDLKPNTKYPYFIFYKKLGNKNFLKSKQFQFSTQKTQKQEFTFTLTADSHLDENCSPEIYTSTLQQIAEIQPDFHIDLGDTFMVDKYGSEFKNSLKQYLAQRYYFGLISANSPLFLVHGNHDGESENSRNGMTEWSKEQREKYFPSKNPKKYYSITWGNALLVVLDPFENTGKDGNDNPWSRTLGSEQYFWLENTLKNSNAKDKLIFIHNLVGGTDIKGKARGGAEVAPFYEWGGKSLSGENDFKKYRPNWDLPIHQLLKKYGVNAVFHGHDHIYAKQEYNGIIYQCVPEPGTSKPGNTNYAKEYGYNGTLYNFPGFLKISVGKSLKVEYLGGGKLVDRYEMVR